MIWVGKVGMWLVYIGLGGSFGFFGLIADWAAAIDSSLVSFLEW